MFDAVDAIADEPADRPAAATIAAPRPAAPAGHPAVAGGRYGERRTISPAAMVLVFVIHALLLGALVFLRPDSHAKVEHRLKVIEVSLTPPPRQPQPEVRKPQPEQIAKVEQVSQMPPPLIRLSSSSPAAPPPPAQEFKPAAAPEAPPAPPAPPAPSAIQGGNLASKMLAGKPPSYPIECRRKREQGTVVLALTVGTDGRVVDISIRSSSGFARLDNAARDAVRKWRWAPATSDGAPVMVRGVVEIPFVLQG